MKRFALIIISAGLTLLGMEGLLRLTLDPDRLYSSLETVPEWHAWKNRVEFWHERKTAGLTSFPGFDPLLGMTKTLPRSQWRLLVVDDDDLVAGLLVEQSLGVQHFLQDSVEETTAEGIEPLKPYVRGAFRHGGHLFYETDLKAILRDEKFFNVAVTNGL